MGFYSPLRYPGGKRKLAPYIQKVINTNKIVGGSYVEPYAGGAGIALYLLFSNVVTNIYINDISVPIYSFWKSVLQQTEAFCALIEKTAITISEWRSQKAVLDDLINHTSLQIGFATFFLNRTNYSGILRGGVIGGQEQSGTYKIDARFNKPNLIQRINRIADLSNNIHISNLDASDFISNTIPDISKNSLTFFDPPYYLKGKKLYEDYYSHNDHKNIAKLISNEVDHPWVISYDNVPEISEFYSDFRNTTYSLYYNANNRVLGSEIMFFCDSITIPKLVKVTPIH